MEFLEEFSTPITDAERLDNLIADCEDYMRSSNMLGNNSTVDAVSIMKFYASKVIGAYIDWLIGSLDSWDLGLDEEELSVLHRIMGPLPADQLTAMDLGIPRNEEVWFALEAREYDYEMWTEIYNSLFAPLNNYPGINSEQTLLGFNYVLRKIREKQNSTVS